MRILHWTESYHPNIGGMEVFSQHLAKKLQSRGHECMILTDDYGKFPGHEIIDNVPVYRVGFRNAFANHNLSAVIRLTRQVEELKKDLYPDILHLQTSQFGAFFYLRTQALSRLPSLYTTHDPILQMPMENSMVQQIFRAVDRIAATSSFMFRRALECNAAVEIKMRLVLNAYPMPEIDPAPLSFDPPVFLGLGRLADEKGFDLLLDAFARVKKHFPLIKMILAGEGLISGALKTQAQILGINDSVEFRGWVVPQIVPNLINESTIVVVPSRWQEPFGLVALQAMQMARPVIAARAGGLPEIVQDGQSGLLFEGENVQSLTNAMLDMLANHDQTCQWGAYGRQYAEKTFDWENCVSNYGSIYHELAR